MRLTKESRVQSREAQFNRLIDSGYVQETYKDLDFFTLNDGKYFTLKVFRGTGANHVEYCSYRTAERRAEIIQNYKNNYERHLVFKADQKEKNKGKSSSHAAASSAIKAELNQAFPGIKFSVKSSSFSGGDSVHIDWTDGPKTKEVEEISGKYQYGHFNGMEDIYENTNSRDDIPQAKYVSESRHQSEQVTALLPAFAALFSPEQSTDWGNTPEQIFYRVFNKTSFPAVFSDLQIIKTDCKGGFWEDFYQFSFTSETVETTESVNIAPIEVKAGTIQVIEYGEKAIAVIGDTRQIKDKLKELGGRFNFRLTCGAGWIFPKSKLSIIQTALSNKPETLKSEIDKTVQFFADTDREIYGDVTQQTKAISIIQNSLFV